MKKAILLCFVLVFLGACSSEEEASRSKAELLSGSQDKQSSQSKAWYQYSQSPDEDECPVTSDVYIDNSFIFFADGTFEFDHGTITESGDCGDFVNFTGTWELSNNDTQLKIIGLQEKGNPDKTFNFELFNAKIVSLEEGKLQLSQTDPDTGTEYNFEFRIK